MNNYRKKPQIWLQVLITAVTLASVAAVIFCCSRYHYKMKGVAAEQFNQQQLILAHCASAGIKAYFKEMEQALSALAELPSIQKMSPECLKCIQHTFRGYPPRTSIRLLDDNGILRFIYPFTDWRGNLAGKNFSKESYFKEAKDTGRTSVSGLIVNEQGEMRIRIAVPVYLKNKLETVSIGESIGVIIKPVSPDEPEFGKFQGLLIASIDPKIIDHDFISPISSGKNGFAWLLNEDGIFLAHREQAYKWKNAFNIRREKNPDISHEAIEQIQKLMMAGKKGMDRYIAGWHVGEKANVEKLIAYTPVDVGGRTWSIAVCATIDETEKIISRTESSDIFTCAFIIAALIAGAASLFIIRNKWSHYLEREVSIKTNECRKTSEYLNNLIRHANAPIIVWDPYQKITIFNKAFEKMSGRTEAEVIMKPLDILFPKESRVESIQKIENASKGSFWQGVEIPILRGNDIRIGLWNSANIHNNQGRLIATVAQGQDITERKKAEDELRKYKEHLEELVEEKTAKLREVNTELESFTYSVSHDLRTPLRTMQMFAQALLEDHADRFNATGKDYAMRIVQSSKDMDKMINDLLDYSKLSRAEIELESVDLNTVLNEVIDQIKSTISEKDAEVIVESPLPEVTGHRSTIVQIIFNLLTNSVKFVSPGVKPKVKIWAESKNGRIRLFIQDNGIGVPSEDHERIFKMFEKLHGIEEYPGTGIGLAIVKKGIERMGGKTGIESETNRGSIFWLTMRK